MNLPGSSLPDHGEATVSSGGHAKLGERVPHQVDEVVGDRRLAHHLDPVVGDRGQRCLEALDRLASAFDVGVVGGEQAHLGTRLLDDPADVLGRDRA